MAIPLTDAPISSMVLVKLGSTYLEFNRTDVGGYLKNNPTATVEDWRFGMGSNPRATFADHLIFCQGGPDTTYVPRSSTATIATLRAQGYVQVY